MTLSDLQSLSGNAVKKSISQGKKKGKKTKPEVLEGKGTDEINGICMLIVNVITGTGKTAFQGMFTKQGRDELDSRNAHGPEVTLLTNMLNDVLGGNVDDALLTSISPFSSAMAGFGISSDVILNCGFTKLTEAQVS